MPEQNTITGIITLANGADRAGIKVQAFDRDLPSLERRAGSGPQMLGEAVTDVEGRFQLTYTLEQFQSGEGISTFRKSREKNADLSFRVFDKTGQELNIKGIEAGHRKYRSDQIIFNAPTPLEVIIFVDAPREVGTSEYEQLMALIAPVVEDLPLIELSDDDVVFLSNELGLEQQREVQQRIEWLRRCALLAQETNLPVEAFYGWGRKNVPAQFSELAAVPLKDLPKVLEKLSSLPDEKLTAAFLTAVKENIIPASLHVRVDEIVRQLKRRDQVLRAVVAQLLDGETNAVLAGYTVTTFDQDAGGESRGLDITDLEGKFLFNFYLSRDVPVDVPARKFSFKVVTPDGETVSEGEPTAINPNRLETETVPVKITVPKPHVPPLEEQLQQAQLQAPPELLKWLRGKEIYTFANIRRKGGLSHFADLPQIDPVMIRTLESLADLDRVSATVQVSKALLDKGYDSVLAIADAPYSEFINLVSDAKTALTEMEVAKLHVMATVQTSLLNNILVGMAANIANGFELPVQTVDPEGGNP